MDSRTDTGFNMPGTGDNSPVPPSAYERMLEERIRVLESKIKMMGDFFFKFGIGLNSGSQMKQPAVQPTTQPTAQPQSPAETPLAQLPGIFVSSVRRNVHRTNMMVRVLRNNIAPVACGHGRRQFRWCHVRIVLTYRHFIVNDANPTEFGRAIAELMPDKVKAENVRKASEGYGLPTKDYREWPDGMPDKEYCLDVEEMLCDAGFQLV